MRKSNLLLKIAQVASLATIATLNVSVSADPVAPVATNELPQICNEWDFVKDSFTDGSDVEYRGGWRTVYGGNNFEVYGMALRQKGSEIMVAFNANIPLPGLDLTSPVLYPTAIPSGWFNGMTDKIIGMGDLIMNFGGVKYGVHFAPNDSSITALGVYKNISTKDVAATNMGHPDLRDHMNGVINAGKTPSMGDVSYTDGYFSLDDRNTKPIVLASGTKVADITSLSGAELPDFATAFGSAVGKYTYGFKFTKVDEMAGDVIAHIFTECINDGVALKTTIAGSCKPLLGEGLTNLVATAGQEGVALSWQMEGDAASLNVWRAEMGADGQYTNIAKIAGGLSDASSYVDAEAVAGITYYYAVEQISFNAENKFSEVVSAIAQ